ncbi:MAG: cytochrome c [Bryobacteraceae bacterium]|jgi:mono/diheme cytochrome c family protein
MKTTTGLLPFFLFCGVLAAQGAPSSTSGKDIFRAYCAACHGAAGKGDGPVAPLLRKRPTDLTLLAKKNDGKFPGAEIAHELKSVYQAPHGSPEMPIWGPFFTELSPVGEALGTLRITNIVTYIQSLQTK